MADCETKVYLCTMKNNKLCRNPIEINSSNGSYKFDSNGVVQSIYDPLVHIGISGTFDSFAIYSV